MNVLINRINIINKIGKELLEVKHYIKVILKI